MIRTFRADRHMDRVECVTVQVPCSHSSGGAVKGWPEVVDALEPPRGYLEGARRLMRVGGVPVEAAAASAVAVGAVASSAIVGGPGRSEDD